MAQTIILLFIRHWIYRVKCKIWWLSLQCSWLKTSTKFWINQVDPNPVIIFFFFNCTVIRPVLEYCAPVFHHALPQYLSDDIERVQKRALSIICPYASYSECLVRFDLVTLHARRVALCSKLFESITSCPDHKLVPVLPPKREHRHNLRQSRAYAMPRTHTNRFKNTFIPSMCT